MRIREGYKILHKEAQSLDSACFLPSGSPSMFSVMADRILENLCRITRKIPQEGLETTLSGDNLCRPPDTKGSHEACITWRTIFPHPPSSRSAGDDVGMARLRGLLPLPPSRDVQPFGDRCFAVPDALVEGYIVSLVKRVLLTPLFLSQVLNPTQCLKKKNVEPLDILLFTFDFLLFVGYTICEPYEKENAYAG